MPILETQKPEGKSKERIYRSFKAHYFSDPHDFGKAWVTEFFHIAILYHLFVYHTYSHYIKIKPCINLNPAGKNGLKHHFVTLNLFFWSYASMRISSYHNSKGIK